MHAQFQMVLEMICVALEHVQHGVQPNSKMMRDLLDVLEGYGRGALNDNGNYSHASLKAKCRHASEAAAELQRLCAAGQLSRQDLLGQTKREHAIPLAVLLPQLYGYVRHGVDRDAVATFLAARLVSVLVTQDEQERLDAAYRNRMPENAHVAEGDYVLSRYRAVSPEIRVVSWPGAIRPDAIPELAIDDALAWVPPE